MDILKCFVGSDSKVKLLGRLLERPKASFSVSELGRLAGLPKASVSNIAREWEEYGLVLSRHQGKNKLVSVNQNYYLLPELMNVFEKTRDFQKPLLNELESMPALKGRNIKAVMAFGSRTRTDYIHGSDLDVLVVLEKKDSAVSEKIVSGFVESTKKTGIRFSPLILDKKGLQIRLKEKDRLAMNILSDGKILKGGKWLGHLQAAP